MAFRWIDKGTEKSGQKSKQNKKWAGKEDDGQAGGGRFCGKQPPLPSKVCASFGLKCWLVRYCISCCFLLLQCFWNNGRLQRGIFNGVDKLYVSLQLYYWAILRGYLWHHISYHGNVQGPRKRPLNCKLSEKLIRWPIIFFFVGKFRQYGKKLPY